MSQILKNVTIKMISLVKKGANNQKLQFCKSADNDSDIICYECSKIRKDEGPSPEMIKEIDSIINSNDSASFAICGIAKHNLNLNPHEDVETQYRTAVWKTMKKYPHIYQAHVETVLHHDGVI